MQTSQSRHPHGPSWASALLIALLLMLVTLLPILAMSGSAAEASGSDRANVRFEAPLAAPPLGLAMAADGQHMAVVDESATFSFLPAAGGQEVYHTIGAGGPLGTADPNPIGIVMEASGDHWGGAIAYDSDIEGKLVGFARWSDQPVWTFQLPDAGALVTADQPTALAAGGPYYAMGTAQGNVYLLRAEADSAGADKRYARHYNNDNDGSGFGRINDVSLSANGKRLLIATDRDDTASLHLFSDTFFIHTFARFQVPVLMAELSPDGNYAAVVTGEDANARVHLIDVLDKTILWETNLGATITTLAIGTDATYLYAGTDAGRIAVFHSTGALQDRAPVHDHFLGEAITDIDISLDGRQAAATTQGGRLLFLHPHHDKPLWSYDMGHSARAVALSATGDGLAAALSTGDAGKLTFTEADHRIGALTPTEPRVVPGETNTIPLTVTNNGNRMETIVPSWPALPSQWVGEYSELTLAPGESGTFPARLTVPPAQAADRYTVPITLVASGQSFEHQLQVRVPEIRLGQADILWSLPMAVPGGAPAAFLLQVQNTGNVQDQVKIGYAKLPAGWDAEFTGPIETTLRPGEDRQIILKVHAPKGAPTGRVIDFQLIFAWDHGEDKLPLELETVSGKAYAAGLEGQGTAPGSSGTSQADALADHLKSTLKDEAAAGPASKAADAEKDSPGIGLVGLLAVAIIGAVVVAKRRKRD